MLNINKVTQLEVTLGEMAARGLLDKEHFDTWPKRAKTHPNNITYLYLYPLDDDNTEAGVFAVIFWIHESHALFDDVVGFLNEFDEETLAEKCEYRWVR